MPFNVSLFLLDHMIRETSVYLFITLMVALGIIIPKKREINGNHNLMSFQQSLVNNYRVAPLLLTCSIFYPSKWNSPFVLWISQNENLIMNSPHLSFRFLKRRNKYFLKWPFHCVRSTAHKKNIISCQY